MPVPKRRTSRSKKKLRRTHYKIATPTLAVCNQCNELKKPGIVCPNCGHYKGLRVNEKIEH